LTPGHSALTRPETSVSVNRPIATSPVSIRKDRSIGRLSGQFFEVHGVAERPRGKPAENHICWHGSTPRLRFPPVSQNLSLDQSELGRASLLTQYAARQRQCSERWCAPQP
jgi:hypothetical protein